MGFLEKLSTNTNPWPLLRLQIHFESSEFLGYLKDRLGWSKNHLQPESENRQPYSLFPLPLALPFRA
jgi:hypothetical protein